MPRGIKRSGRGRKPSTKPGQPRKRGRRRAELAPQIEQEGKAQAGGHQTASSPQEKPHEQNGKSHTSPAASAQTPQDPALAEAERILVEKYPNCNIVAGSLRPGSAEGFKTKRVVTIHCARCNEPRVVCTSDLFHVRHCLSCSKADKKASSKSRKAAKP
jgi:hypothetical protein